MAARWFKREQDRPSGFGSDPVDERIERQAKRAGRSVEEEHEQILRDVMPNVRKTVAEAGLTMDQYLRLNRVEYHDLHAARSSSRSFFGRHGGLIDYDSFVRLRRWIHEAAERAGEDAESLAVRIGTDTPRRPWERKPPEGPAAVGTAPDDVLRRLERLAALRDSGALTDDEFQAQKQRLLGD